MVNLDFKQIILYGPCTYEHQNGWMFCGFYKAFLYKRYKVIWVNQERISLLDDYDLSNSLFITDGTHDENIPLRHDSFYLLFQNRKSKYDGYDSLYLDIYNKNLSNVTQWKDKSYIQYSLENRELYFPLATELVPEEILINQQRSILTYPGDKRTVCLLGNLCCSVRICNCVSKICSDLKINSGKNFYKYCIVNNFKSEDRAKHIRSCQISPIISTHIQIEEDQIDYRVFQIISYGGFPVTNSKITRDMFDENCIYYSTSGKDLLLKGIEHKKTNFTDEWKWKLMEHVKNNHTYVKRIDTIFWMLMRI